MNKELAIIDECSRIFMPFGKYKDICLLEIPLRYLDETVSSMPPQWIIRKAMALVDEAMNHPQAPSYPGPESFDDLEKKHQKQYDEQSN